MEPTSALQIASRTPPQRKVAGSESWLRKMDRGMLSISQFVGQWFVISTDGSVNPLAWAIRK